jgi:quercetin dioxygenase-like cupin family protein
MQRDYRRIVTGHNAKGEAIVLKDETGQSTQIPSGEAFFAKLWVSDRTPVDNRGDADGALIPTGLTVTGGSVLRIVDIPAGNRSPMHRTHSLDYGIVLEGEITMELDSGDTVHLKAGDVVVQRGTNHLWANNSSSMTRIIFILIDATPLQFGGQTLPPTL